MILEAGEVNLKDVEVLETLKESEFSVVFKVLVHETTYVLKVYHNFPEDRRRSGDPEARIYVLESTAYHRLKAKGLCKQKVIPHFYGTITDIQPSRWPYLWIFKDNEASLTAILIEYVQNMHQIDLSNFSPQNVEILREILEKIHQAGVLHNDPYPRNMMISKDPITDEVSVLWIDFDRAKTLPGRPSRRSSKDQKRWFEEEMSIFDEYIQALTQDNEQGELYHADYWYTGCAAPLGWVEDYEWVREKYAIPEPPPGPTWEEWQQAGNEQESDWRIVVNHTKQVTPEWVS